MTTEVMESVFPRKADLEGIITEGCSTSVKCKLQSHGVFLACQKESFADHLERFVLSENFYREAFGFFERAHHGLALTGVRFKIKDCGKFEQDLKDMKGSIIKGKYNPKFLSIDESDNAGDYICKVRYEKLNPRFVAYRRYEPHDIEVHFRKLNGGVIEVCSNPRSNTDAIIVRDVATEVMNNSKGDLSNMNIAQLSVRDRVGLFDEIITDKASRDWRIDEVCGLSVRSADTENEEKDVNLTDTRVLHSAVLEGKGLREHPIVKDLVKDRFFFYAATVWTSSNDGKSQVRLKIDFKQNPHVLVITAETARKLYEDENGRELWDSVSVPEDVGQECTRYYWDLVHSVFEKLRKTIKGSSPKVKRRGIKKREEK